MAKKLFEKLANLYDKFIVKAFKKIPVILGLYAALSSGCKFIEAGVKLSAAGTGEYLIERYNRKHDISSMDKYSRFVVGTSFALPLAANLIKGKNIEDALNSGADGALGGLAEMVGRGMIFENIVDDHNNVPKAVLGNLTQQVGASFVADAFEGKRPFEEVRFLIGPGEIVLRPYDDFKLEFKLLVYPFIATLNKLQNHLKFDLDYTNRVGWNALVFEEHTEDRFYLAHEAGNVIYMNEAQLKRYCENPYFTLAHEMGHSWDYTSGISIGLGREIKRGIGYGIGAFKGKYVDLEKISFIDLDRDLYHGIEFLVTEFIFDPDRDDLKERQPEDLESAAEHYKP